MEADPLATVTTFPDSANTTRTTKGEVDLLGRVVRYTDEQGRFESNRSAAGGSQSGSSQADRSSSMGGKGRRGEEEE